MRYPRVMQALGGLTGTCLVGLALSCGSAGDPSGPPGSKLDVDAGRSIEGGHATDARSDHAVTTDANSAGDARSTLPDGGGCVPEAVVTCSCSSGSGTERCLADGSGWGVCTCVSYGLELAVSPNGNDSAAGTLAAPFLTLERAQTAVRSLKAAGPLPAGGVVVWLRKGIYPRTATFALTALDSGTATAPVVYRGYPGEIAEVVGGVALPPSDFQLVTSASAVWSRLDPTAQGQVVSLDLGGLGVTDYGTLSPRGTFVTGVPAALELFIDGVREPLGRWPDADQDDWSSVPESNAAQLTVYGSGVVPDVTGTYVMDSTQDGASSFTRQGQVDGKTYHLYRTTGGTAPNTWVAWFLTTNASGYPATTDPFFFIYQSTFGTMSGAQGGVGNPAFVDPTAVIYGFEGISTVSGASAFTLAENRTARWTTAPDAWVHGFFAYPWADNRLPVSSVDPTTGLITMNGTGYDGLLETVVQGGGASPVYAYNLLEEITEPGEWYLDRTAGELYLWPPTSLAQHEILASVLSTPLVTVNGASYVTLQEVTLEASRAELLQVGGGSANIQIEGCTLRNSGDCAAQVTEATNVTLDGDLIYGTGEDGVQLGGGDRPSLTKGNNVVQNSVIHDFSEWVWTYTPAVNFSGNGNTAQHNVLYGSPHSAILFYSSSQQTIEYNDIYDVLKFSSDAGAIYSWGDWGGYGNLVQWNFIHDITSELGGFGVHGVYLDDCLSGPTVSSNVLYNFAGTAIFHNGGHDVDMNNNLVVGCDAVLEATSYCATHTTSICAGGQTDFHAQLVALDYQQDPWASAYPACAAVPDDCATLTASQSPWLTPFGSTFTDNVSFENASLYVADSAATVASYASFGNNLQGEDPLFVDVTNENFNLMPSSPALALPGFVPIPFDSIGLQHP